MTAQTSVQEAIAVLRENSNFITEAGKSIGVHPRLMASVIYIEHVLNVTWVDRELDVTLANYGLNTSLGLGQVKISTAQWVELQLKDTSSEYFLNDSIRLIFPFSTSREDLIHRLANPRWNSYFIAAYLAVILKRWSGAGVPLNDRVDIVATLYSAGVEKSRKETRKPHPKPVSNEFGTLAKAFFDSEILVDVFPR